MLIEWVYKDKLEASSQGKKAACTATEVCIYLAYIASIYKIKRLSDVAVEQLGVCHLVNAIPASSRNA